MDLYTLLKQFNSIGGIEQTGQPGFCLLMTLWQKANELNWANEFTMTNTELLYRAGFRSDDTLRRTRNNLQQQGFLKYKKPSNRRNCGSYVLEFNLLKAFGYESYRKIDPSSEGRPAGSDEGSSEGRPAGSDEGINKHTKHTKHTNKEKSEIKFPPESTEYKLSEYLYKKILVNDSKYKKPNLYKWAEHIDKLIRINKRDDLDEIKRVIDFATSNSFWKSNVLSTAKLRDKYSTLKMQMEEQSSKNGIPTKNPADRKEWEYLDDGIPY